MSFSSGNMEIRNDIPTSTCTSLEEEKITSSASRTFQENWKRDHFWLRYDSNKNAMFCTVCENANCKNIFATTGCQNFRTSSLNDHIASKDHKSALFVPTCQRNEEKREKKSMSEEKRSMIVKIEAIHWIVKEDLPLKKYESLLDLLHRLDTPYVYYQSDKSKTTADHHSNYSAMEILKAMLTVVEEETKQKLSESPFVTVLADESTDIAVRKKLIMYAQVTSPTLQPSTLFITNVDLKADTGDLYLFSSYCIS